MGEKDWRGRAGLSGKQRRRGAKRSSHKQPRNISRDEPNCERHSSKSSHGQAHFVLAVAPLASPCSFRRRSKKSLVARYPASQLRCNRKSCTSSGKTSCSMTTPRARRRATRSTVCVKYTLRSSSPWMKSTGDFHVSTEVTGEDS